MGASVRQAVRDAKTGDAVCGAFPAPDWDGMRDELMQRTVADLRATAKAEGICLGYASRKADVASAIVTWRRHAWMEGEVNE